MCSLLWDCVKNADLSQVMVLMIIFPVLSLSGHASSELLCQ